MTDTKQPEALRQAARLRNVCAIVRSKNYPLSDLIPLMQEAADTLERTDSENTTLQAGYDAARLEIEALRSRQCLHQIAEPAHPAGEYPPQPKPALPRGGFPDLFDADQMRAYVDADRAMRAQAAPAAVAAPLRINLREQGAELRKVFCFPGGPEIWALYRDGVQVRYLNEFENDFVDSALVAPPTTQAEPVAQGDAEDAARYRWLRNKSTVLHGTAWLGSATAYQRDVAFLRRDDALAALDAAIDAALGAQGKEGGAA